MMGISVSNMTRKLNKFLEKNLGIVDKEGYVKDCWVAGKNDPEYPEGTIIFEVVDKNVTPMDLQDTMHELIIYPDKLGRLN